MGVLQLPFDISSSSSKTLINFPKSSNSPPPTSSSSLLHFSRTKSKHYYSSSLSHSQTIPQNNSSNQKSKPLLLLQFQNQSLKFRTDLVEKLNDIDSDTLQILEDDGDWSKEHFWAVVMFLKQSSRSKDILQVFELWKSKENSRNNEFNYEKIIRILTEEELTEEAVLALREMKNHGLKPSVEIYNSVIHGFTRKGRIEDAMVYLKEMEEIGLKPDTETYEGFIQAYGNYKMYDEMSQCVQKMESNGCLPDHITYNLLIREFARAGLLKKMEQMNKILASKKMGLQSSTLVSMLEAYASFRVLDKMERVYRRVWNLKTPLNEDLVRKVTLVYIENYMFSRLDELGSYLLCTKTGPANLAWCLRVLSYACLSSRKGMDSMVEEMELKRVAWDITIANIILLAYLKMRSFRDLNIVLSQLGRKNVKPDIVTVGIVFDASRVGFDGIQAIRSWRRTGFFEESVDMNTDALVFDAFGKGSFIKSCEEMYSSLGPESRKSEVWSYHHLVDLVIKHDKQLVS